MLSGVIYGLLLSFRYIQSLQSIGNLHSRICNKLQAQGNSGIYQYQGKGPPPELAKLFGINSNDGNKKPKGRTTVRKYENSGSLDKKQSKARQTEAVEDLEKDLILKYRSSAYKSLLDDDDDWEEAQPQKSPAQGKFEGFQRAAPISSRDKETMERDEKNFYRGLRTLSRPSDSKDEPSKGESPTSPRKSLLLGRLHRLRAPKDANKVAFDSVVAEGVLDYEGFDRAEEESVEEEPAAKKSVRKPLANDNAERAGPLNAIHGYRLRKPISLSPEQQAKVDATVAAQAAREAAALERKKAKRLQDDSQFTPFDFDDATVSTEADELFTSLSFEDIGVKNEVVLRNLERMRMFNPTKIQELSIPSLSEGKNIVMQAQTGSGKTLAFL